MKKPSFNVSNDGKTVEVDGIVYSLYHREIGENIERLQTNCQEGFRATTFRELLNLMHSAYINKEIKEAEELVRYSNLKDKALIANTITQVRGSGLIVSIDNPQFVTNEHGNRAVDEKDLVAKLRPKDYKPNILGNLSIGKGARSMPISELESGVFNPFTILAEKYPILLTGCREAPEKLAQISEIAKKEIRLVIKDTNSTMAPIFGVYSRVCVGNTPFGHAGGFYSFDVRKSS